MLALLFGVVTTANAYWQYLAPVTGAVMWLGRAAASNPTMARAVEWSITAHGALLSWYFWKNDSDPAPTSTPIKARLAVQPTSTAQRDNPDPNLYDNAPAGQRDPTPKSSVALTTIYPQAGSVNSIGLASLDSEVVLYSAPNAGYANKMTFYTPSNKQYPGQPYTNYASWTVPAGNGSLSGTALTIYYKYESVQVTCPSGYTLSGSSCLLTNADATKKPAGKVPCEVVSNSDGTWDVDAKNPECDKLASALTKSGKTLSYNKGDGTYDQITNNDDGSQTIQTGNRKIKTGPPGGDGNRPISSIDDTGPSGGSGSGSGTGTGSTGTGSAVCGGPGLPSCAVSVDDSGFNGKDGTINSASDAAKAKLDDRQASITAQGTDSSNFGLDTSWLPSFLPGPAVQCAPLKWEPGISHGPLVGTQSSVDIDWCSHVDVFREYYAWLIGLLTVWAIAMLFFSSNGNTGRGGK